MNLSQGSAMREMMCSCEEAVARFVVDFGSDQIGPQSREHVRNLLKDQLANQVGAAQLPWSRQVRAFRMLHPGNSTIVGENVRADPVDAAYLNATFGHGFEYDDFNGNAHPGCCVVPTALALGEALGSTLEEVVVALVTGYEVYVRIGYLCSPKLLNEGWQPHSVLANFGAAAVAAKLYGLSPEKAHDALGIALSHAGGTTEYASTGGSIKRVHAGIAVRNGIEAARLALSGITGPRRYLTGDRGFFRMFPDQEIHDEDATTFYRDAALQLNEVKFKPYCCCAATHGYIQLMEKISSRAADINRVDVGIQTMTDAIVGNRNANIYLPRTIEELQYSLPVQMSLAALGAGNGYRTHRDFIDGKLDIGPGSAVSDLAGRMSLSVSPALDERYPRIFVAEAEVHYRDGTSEHLFTDAIKGSPANPFTSEETRAKFDELTIEPLGRKQSILLFEAIDRLAPEMPVTELTRLLRPN